MKRAVIFLLVVLAAYVVVRELRPPSYTPGWDFGGFGQLPVLEGGRIQPIESVARNSLLATRRNTTVPVPLLDEAGEPVIGWFGRERMHRMPPGEYAAMLFFDPTEAAALEVFRVDFRDMQGELRLTVGPDKFFSLEAIAPRIGALGHLAAEAAERENHERTAMQRSAVQLNGAISFFISLNFTAVNPQPHPAYRDTVEAVDRFLELMVPVSQALRLVEGEEDSQPDPELMAEFMDLVAYLQRWEQVTLLRLVPPLDPAADPDGWTSIATAVLAVRDGVGLDPVARGYLDLGRAYREGDAARFSELVSELTELTHDRIPESARKRVAMEYQLLNQAQPFMMSAGLYVLVFLIAVCAWIGWTRELNRTAFWIAFVAFVIHTIALMARIYVSGRPPVTNLYSSAVFIGWGAIGLGLLMDALTKRGYGVLVGSVLGFLSLLVAHYLALSGDTLALLEAVLDDNFWLATHVIVITLGYVAVFVAGALGIVYILVGLFTPKLDKSTGRSMANLTYGVICFGLLFSFIGTILGGIWADQSWGRFWGWDPKENGALIIVIWCAIILHARWGGYIRERGVMVMAIFGNIVTSWSWFGTNFLGVGLHSYGFHEGGFFWLSIFVVSQLFLMALGGIPLRFWRSTGGNRTPLNAAAG